MVDRILSFCYKDKDATSQTQVSFRHNLATSHLSWPGYQLEDLLTFDRKQRRQNAIKLRHSK